MSNNLPTENDSPYSDVISRMASDEKTITTIFAEIKAEGYAGSYSLLQQYCHRTQPVVYRAKKATRKIKRKELATMAWSGKNDLSENDMIHIKANYPIAFYIIFQFRTRFFDFTRRRFLCFLYIISTISDFPFIYCEKPPTFPSYISNSCLRRIS